MSHEVETMAYANAVPWHGLGANIEQGASVEEMLEAAGLNWELQKTPLLADLGDGERLRIDDKAAWVRNTDNKVMAVSSKNWRPLQPRQTLEFMRNYVEAGAATLETAGSLREGKMVWGLARLSHDFEVRKGDKVNGYLLISSPNEVGKAITIRTTTVRVVCANTMAMAAQGGTVLHRQNHLTDFDVESAKEAVGNAHEQLAQAETNAKTLDAMKLNIQDAVEKVVVPTFFPEVMEQEDWEYDIHQTGNQPKKLQAIIDSINNAPGNKEVEGTGWSVLNGITHWADHVHGHNPSSRLASAWSGDNGQRKLEAERRLLELAA